MSSWTVRQEAASAPGALVLDHSRIPADHECNMRPISLQKVDAVLRAEGANSIRADWRAMAGAFAQDRGRVPETVLYLEEAVCGAMCFPASRIPHPFWASVVGGR